MLQSVSRYRCSLLMEDECEQTNKQTNKQTDRAYRWESTNFGFEPIIFYVPLLFALLPACIRVCSFCLGGDILLLLLMSLFWSGEEDSTQMPRFYLLPCLWSLLAQRTLDLSDLVANGTVITVQFFASIGECSSILARFELADGIGVHAVQPTTAIQQPQNIFNQTCSPHTRLAGFILRW